MTQFDETTERKAEERCPRTSENDLSTTYDEREAYKAGRNSAKASLLILARAVDEVETAVVFKRMELPELLQAIHHKLREAKRKIKANGDWPLGDE